MSIKEKAGISAGFYCFAITGKPRFGADGIGRVGGSISAGDARNPHAGALGGSTDRRGDICRVSGQRGDVVK